MAECESRKIDSNISGLAIAEEECLKQLPETVAGTAASGTVTMNTAGTDGDSVTVNGVTKTLKTSPVGADDVLIAGSAGATATNLALAIAGIPGVDVNTVGAVITVTAQAVGVAGNSYTLTKTGTSISVSGSGTLSGGVDETSGAVWYDLDPNSYTDFGGEVTSVARAPIDPSRQNKKGTISDLDASGGFNIDFTQNNLVRLMQGFFFADARELPGTDNLNAAKIPVTAVSTSKYSAASVGMAAGDLVLAYNFGTAANNGLKTTSSADGTGVTVAETLVAEASPPATAGLKKVGRVLGSGDCAVVMSGNVCTLVLTTGNWTDHPTMYMPGRWIYIGGDAATNRFTNIRGFARVSAVTAKVLTLDDCAFVPAADAGSGKSIHIYTGTLIRNEKDPALIKRRSYSIERTLGSGPDGVQAQYLEGSVANEFTLNVPLSDKLNADLSYIACDDTQRSGSPGDTRKAGAHVGTLGEAAYNTSSSVQRIKLHVHDDTTSTPAALFGYISEATISINNGVTPNKAIGVLGAFDTSAGNFTVGGSMTVYFQTVEAVKAVKNNADVGISMIGAARNAGFLFDIPLLSLGGGRPNVEKDSPITLPLTPSGAENKWGYTMQYQIFEYLPKIAIA